ncbi:MAG: monovalent cation/H+ antiporter subunit D family protein [Alphaproteobacteria bacterium]|nr:monovalent cation/H+ antiporter subunit D family protein [Alphaproteobacteria bacterium]
MGEHLPILIVVTPLLAAGVTTLLRNGRVAWFISLAVSWFLPILSAMLILQVQEKGIVSYALGGWAPPIGIEYRVDIVNAFVLFIVTSVGAIAMPYALMSVERDIDEEDRPWFYAIYLLALTGLLGMTVTGDAFNIFVFMEISSLAMYVLIAMGRDKRALIAAYQYLIMGTVGATFFVIGVGFLYITTGSLNLADIALRIGPAFAESSPPIMAALAFLVVGISLKLALFPLHVWLPNAYAFAPSFATVFLAATATKVAVYVLLRIYFSVFGTAITLSDLPVTEMLLLLSLAAMFVASILAIYEDSIARMLAFSSVAQIGYITLGIALANTSGVAGSAVHLMNHAAMKAALFAAIGAVVYRAGTSRVSELGGIGHKMPITMGAFVVAGLSIIGVPGTAGFISKWYLGVGAIEHGWWSVAFLIVASSLISVIYIGRVVEAAYFQPVSEASQKASDPPLTMLASILVFTGLTIYIGLDTSWSGQLAEQVAAVLVGGLSR